MDQNSIKQVLKLENASKIEKEMGEFALDCNVLFSVTSFMKIRQKMNLKQIIEL